MKNTVQKQPVHEGHLRYCHCREASFIQSSFLPASRQTGPYSAYLVSESFPPPPSSARAFNANRYINSFLFQPFPFRARQSGVLASAGKPMLLLRFKTSHIHQIQDNTSRKLLQSEPTSCRGPLSSHLLPTSVLSVPRPA